MVFASGSSLANRQGTLSVSTANASFPSGGTMIFNYDDQVTTAITITGNYPTLTSDLTIQTGGINTSVGNVTIAGAISGNFGINKTLNGTLIFSGANTYTGTTTVTAGTLKAGILTSAFGSNSAVSLANNSGVILDITGFNNTIGSLTGGGASGGNVTLGAATLTIGSDNTSPAAYAGIISGTGAITKSGTGTLILSGSNTYSGLTTISSGTLKLGANGGATNTPLGTTGAGTVVSTGAVLDLAGFTLGTTEALTLNGTGLTALPAGALTNTGANASYSGAITLGSDSTITSTSLGTLTCSGAVGNGAYALTLDGAAGTATMSGAISTPTTITKNGLCTWVLSGTNTYTGTTVVSAGTLQLGSTSALGATTNNFTISSGAKADVFSNVTVNSLTLGTLGTANGTWGFTGSGATYINSTYFVTSTTGKITVSTDSRVTPTVTPTIGTYTYTGLVQGPDAATNTGTGTSYTFSYSGTGGTTYGSSTTKPKNAGNYTVTATVSASTDGFYKSASSIATAFSIGGAALTVTATGPSKTYGNALTAGTSSTNFTVTGTPASGESLTSVTLTPNAAGLSATTAAGAAYVVTPSAATGTGGFLASNYNITYTPFNGTVATKTLTITANNGTKVYGTTQSTPVSGSTAFGSTGLQNGESIGSVTLTYGAGALTATAAVGSTSSITPSAATGGTFTASNYSINYTPNSGTLTVTAAPLTITANNGTKVYGTTQSTPVSGSTAFGSTGLQNGESIGSVTLTYGAGALTATAAVGSTSTITPSAATGGTFTASNYSINYTPNSGTLTVTAAPLIIAANDATKCFNEAFTFENNEFTSSGLQNGESIGSVTLTSSGASSGALSGSYPIVPSGANGGTFTASNYYIVYTNGTFIVNPILTASVSISSSATTICSGDSVTFTATPTNGGTVPTYLWKVNGTSVVGVTTATFTTSTLATSDVVSVVMTSNATSCLSGSPAISNDITMTVNLILTASVSISASATTICTGTSVTFTATPTNGGTSPTYQWQINGVDVSGETASTFSTSTLVNADVVTVIMTSNATSCLAGSPATSNSVTMNVNTILTASVSISTSATTICSGDTVTFTATPTNGGTTPAYQWQINGVNVSGETASTFVTTTLANTNEVTVVMTSSITTCITGSPAISNTVTMTVNDLPTATISNNGSSICSGSSVAFTITGTSGAVVTYNLNGGSNTTVILTGGSTNIVVSGVTSAQTLNLVSVAGTSCSVALGTSSTVSLDSTTWNGTTWSNGAPTSSTAVIFAASYAISSDFAACNISVSSGATVSVASGSNVSLYGAINVATGGTFTLNNNANLYQSDASATNTGNIVVKRNTNPLIRLDYTLWSSPVSGQQLFAFSPLTSISPTIRFYTYNTTTNLYNSVTSPASTNFTIGTGYLIRLPYNHPTAPAIWTGSFTGVPNNGTQTVTLNNIAAGQRYNAVGNPYPSPISIAQLATDNASNIESTMYFWRKTNNASNPSYCTWNTSSDTFGSDGEAYATSPLGVIQTGQGFIVEAKASATSMQFNNGQRIVDNAGQFFKSTSVATASAI